MPLGESARDVPLRIGVDAAPPGPLCLGVPGEVTFAGFEVDLMHALGDRLGRPVVFDALRWTELLAKLDTADLDLVCTAATITPERARRFLFSTPYLRTQLALICRRDHVVTGLEGGSVRVAVRPGTPAEAYATRHRAEASTFHMNTEIYHALEEGSVDAVIDDLPIGAWFAAQSASLHMGARLPGTDALYGLVLARDNQPLKGAIDAALQTLFQDGTYARLYDAWLVSLVGRACDITSSDE